MTTWPELPLEAWEATRATLHMWTQVVGKTRMLLSAPQNHYWHVPLYVSARGLTTSAIPHPAGVFDIEFDFIEHRLVIRVCDGRERTLRLEPRSVAAFYREYTAALVALDVSVRLTRLPCEVPNPIRFDQDEAHASYDPQYVQRFWRILQQTDRALKDFRSMFLCKVSPVHFFWGSFDMAFTVFSGRPAPPKEGADPITREAYSHEVISCGFWPGDARYPAPAFYAYAAPSPPGLDGIAVRPPQALYQGELGEFILPYDAVRQAQHPHQAIIDFARSTFDGASRLAGWDSSLCRTL